MERSYGKHYMEHAHGAVHSTYVEIKPQQTDTLAVFHILLFFFFYSNMSTWFPHLFSPRHYFLFHQKERANSGSWGERTSIRIVRNFSPLLSETQDLCKSFGDLFYLTWPVSGGAEEDRGWQLEFSRRQSDVELDDWLLTDGLYASHALS